MLATRNSRWIAGAVGVCLLLAVGTWFLLVGPRLDHAAQLRDEALAAQAQNDTLATQIEQLKAQYADLPKKKAELAAVNQEFPAVAEVPTLLRKVNTLAGGAGVTVTSLTPGAAVVASGAAGAAGTAGATGGTDPNALVSIPVSLDVNGDYFQTAQFVKQLQTSLDRAFLITAVTVTQGGGDAAGGETTGAAGGGSTGSATSGQVGLQITGSIFALPDPKAATATAAAAGTGTAAVNGTGTTTSGGTN
jgi:Tfp pilus assembly protein PilO